MDNEMANIITGFIVSISAAAFACIFYGWKLMVIFFLFLWGQNLFNSVVYRRRKEFE